MRRVVAVAGALLLSAGCGQSAHHLAGPPVVPSTPPAAVPTSAAPVPVATPSRPPAPATHRPSSRATTPRPTPRPASHPRVAPGSPVDHLVGVGSATQVVSVIASGYGSSYATVTAYRKTSTGWHVAMGPWSARIGRNGFAPSGQKREGDGRTPTGSYGFSFFFGVDAAPSGLRYEWRHAATYDVWDDDPSSPRYNEWVDTRSADAGADPEPMHQTPSYDAAAVIAYNTARTPGLGSAIFFHVSHGSATAGCVSVPYGDVVALLRWLDPKRAPRIIMGTRSAATR
jgi:L,D-peptidoglycan transpeptidase YkuD (ErfK/YbiS/YcfS/YnhG family)